MLSTGNYRELPGTFEFIRLMLEIINKLTFTYDTYHFYNQWLQCFLPGTFEFVRLILEIIHLQEDLLQ